MASVDALPAPRRAWLARPGAYAAILALALVAALLYKLRFDGIFACPAGGSAADAYLADCQAEGYGDYDHGAFWFGLEPSARSSAAAADVLFVGSSRLQFALSTRATTDWFAAAAARPYLLGFSHSETVAFVEPLLVKLQPRAKVFVINVDRFFDDRITPPLQQIRGDNDSAARYGEKRLWQAPHAALCSRAGWLCGHRTAVYRSKTSGAWRLHGAAPDKGQPISDGPPAQRERWAQFARIGDDFVARLPAPTECILLTIVPSVDTRRAEAQAIAATLGVPLIAPQLEGLRTFDGSHLDRASAERWSAAFYEAAGPRIRDCLARQ